MASHVAMIVAMMRVMITTMMLASVSAVISS